MESQILGSVKSGKGRKNVQVKWNPASKEVYVAYAGWTSVGKAQSAGEAMNKAEAWLYDK